MTSSNCIGINSNTAIVTNCFLLENISPFSIFTFLPHLGKMSLAQKLVSPNLKGEDELDKCFAIE